MLVYLFDDLDSISDDELSRLISLLPEERRRKALRYRFRRDRLACAVAYMLLKHALRSRGIGSFAFAEAPGGKPFLPDHPGVHFNLSHSVSGCVCALSDREVGIDIQDIAQVRENVLRLVCCESELAAIAASDDPDREFTRIWCMKEAYLKMLGTGITGGLKATDTSALKNLTVLDRGGYIIAASSEEAEDVTLMHTGLEDLLK
ncbi:4'-phosphopantetheinyl transferase [Ruminococcaceae bacterium FB2012]|nr:4'-phosphopantetheinyl transferase [Ruminococcaceae bacterium FB2012]